MVRRVNSGNYGYENSRNYKEDKTVNAKKGGSKN